MQCQTHPPKKTGVKKLMKQKYERMQSKQIASIWFRYGMFNKETGTVKILTENTTI